MTTISIEWYVVFTVCTDFLVLSDLWIFFVIYNIWWIYYIYIFIPYIYYFIYKALPEFKKEGVLFLEVKSHLNQIKQDNNPNALKLFSSVLNMFASSEYKS